MKLSTFSPATSNHHPQFTHSTLTWNTYVYNSIHTYYIFIQYNLISEYDEYEYVIILAGVELES